MAQEVATVLTGKPLKNLTRSLAGYLPILKSKTKNRVVNY